ncbi:MAG: hypothetical protein AAF928_21950 [Myxococcota bacterium]
MSRTTCRTPNADGATNIPTWKFDAVRKAILAAVTEAGTEGLPFKSFSDEVAARLTEEERAGLGSVGWHATTVKLELEVRGELRRLPGASPQRLVRGDG